jgi:serine/threonine protein kinase/formylglycine-generating enzyme required for sulfatase activity/WD40 repeat protein
MTAPNATQCPPESVLSDFGLGKLDAANAETISKHIETCADCRRRVAGVSGDSFVGRLRQAGGAAPPAARRERTYVPGESLSNAANSTDGAEDGLPRPSRSIAGEKPRDGLGSPSSVSAPPELMNHPDYELIKELGQGGMGTVYLAKNRMMDRPEVLKVISKALLDRPGALERFQQEIRSAAKLAHPNIVAAYSVLRPGDLLVFAMEYVKGQDLSEVVKARGPLPVTNAAFYIHQVANGLQHAFEKGMVHRDIKPNNLMLAIEGKKHVVKILDFGLAKATSEKAGETGLTKSGQMLGTPDYVAPEQTLDAHKADIRADVYSLGCTLYFLLSGGPPFQETSLYAILEAHHKREPKPLNLMRPEVPVELATVVAKMMAKDPTKRYQTPIEVAKALVPFFKAGQAVATPAPTGATQSQFAGETAHGLGTSTPVSPLAPPPTPFPLSAAAPPHALAMAELLPEANPSEQFNVSIDTHRPSAVRRGRWSSLPPWQRWALAGVPGAAVLLLGIVLLLQTKDGVIRVEINDPQIEVAIKGTDIVLKQADNGHDVKLSPGKKTLIVERGKFTFETDKLILKKGETVTVAVTLLDGQVEVKRGNKVIRKEKLPIREADSAGQMGVSDTTNAVAGGANKDAIDLNASPTCDILRGHSGMVQLLGFTPARSRGGSWPRCPRSLGVQFLAFTPDGSRLVSASNSGYEPARYQIQTGNDNSVRIWSLDPPRQIWRFNVNDGSRYGPQCLVVSPDSRLVCISASWYWGGSPDPSIQILDIETGIKKQSFKLSGDRAMRAVSFSKNGTAVYAARSGKTLHEWSLQTGTETAVVERGTAGPGEMPLASLFTPDGDRIVSGDWKGAIRMWNRATGDQIREYQGHQKNLTSITVSPDGKRLLSAGEDLSVRLWDTDSGKELLALTGLDILVNSVAIAPNNKWFATGENDGAVRIRETATGKQLLSLPGGSCPMLSLAISPNGKMIAAGGEDGNILLWKIESSNLSAAAGNADLIAAEPKSSTTGVPNLPTVTPPPVVAPFDAPQARAQQEAWAKHLGVPVEQTNSIDMKLVLVPPGEFTMGSTTEQVAQAKKLSEGLNEKLDRWMLDRLDEEMPAHSVTITSPYLMGATEVTVGQFRRFADSTGSRTDAERYGGGNSGSTDEKDIKKKQLTWCAPGYAVAESSNVSQVTWNDAVAYCNWLSEAEHLAPCYRRDEKGGWLLESSGKGYRLPTEAEWEYACRAGTTTQFSFGDDPARFPQYGWKEAFGPIPRPFSVAAKMPNAFGFYDMHGNAFEWCHDWYGRDYYAKSPDADPTGPASPFGGWRVRRGGHYGWLPLVFCRSAYRAPNGPSAHDADTGFRVVRVSTNTDLPFADLKRSFRSTEEVGTRTTKIPPSPNDFVNAVDLPKIFPTPSGSAPLDARGIAKTLARPANSTWDKVPLAQVVRNLRTNYRMNVLIDDWAFARAGADPRKTLVTWNARRGSLDLALRTMIEPGNLAWTIHHDGLWLTTKPQGAPWYWFLELVAYRTNAAVRPGTTKQFTDSIEKVDATSWATVGGHGTLKLGKGVLLVRQRSETQREIERRFSTQLRRIGSPAASFPPSDAVRTALQSTISLSLNGEPLQGVLEAIDKKYDLAILVKTKALEARKIDPSAPCYLELDRYPLGKALEALLKSHGLTYLVDGDVISVTAEDDAATILSAIEYDADAAVRAFGNIESVVTSIQSLVQLLTWEKVGGRGTLRPVPGASKLLIDQTYGVHADLHDFFALVRAATGDKGEHR